MRNERNAVGYEIIERYDGAHGVEARLCFWLGDYNRQLIVDRTYNEPAERRCVATVRPNGSTGSYSYKLHGGAKGGWRSGWANDYEGALAAVDRWIKRRFARVAN